MGGWGGGGAGESRQFYDQQVPQMSQVPPGYAYYPLSSGDAHAGPIPLSTMMGNGHGHPAMAPGMQQHMGQFPHYMLSSQWPGWQQEPPMDQGAHQAAQHKSHDFRAGDSQPQLANGGKVLVTDPDTGRPILIKPFLSKQSEEKRREVASGKRVYKCPFCDHLFSCSSNLTRHKRAHTGDKP